MSWAWSSHRCTDTGELRHQNATGSPRTVARCNFAIPLSSHHYAHTRITLRSMRYPRAISSEKKIRLKQDSAACSYEREKSENHEITKKTRLSQVTGQLALDTVPAVGNSITVCRSHALS